MKYSLIFSALLIFFSATPVYADKITTQNLNRSDYGHNASNRSLCRIITITSNKTLTKVLHCVGVDSRGGQSMIIYEQIPIRLKRG